ncbi:hypothetical protein ACWDLG_34635 [Nonomuraea sp. NPDC003727]
MAGLADGWLPYPPQAQIYARERAAIQQSAARAVTPGLYATLCLDEDPERARRRLRESVERYYNAPWRPSRPSKPCSPVRPARPPTGSPPTPRPALAMW